MEVKHAGPRDYDYGFGIASLADLVHFDEELGSGVLKRVSEPLVLKGKSSAAERSR